MIVCPGKDTNPPYNKWLRSHRFKTITDEEARIKAEAEAESFARSLYDVGRA